MIANYITAIALAFIAIGRPDAVMAQSFVLNSDKDRFSDKLVHTTMMHLSNGSSVALICDSPGIMLMLARRGRLPESWYTSANIDAYARVNDELAMQLSTDRIVGPFLIVEGWKVINAIKRNQRIRVRASGGASVLDWEIRPVNGAAAVRHAGKTCPPSPPSAPDI
jgi:hypothetical protein